MILIRISKLELTKTGIFDCLRMDFGKKLQEDLADIHILTGINGTGKSTVLYALAGAIDQFEIRKRFINKDSLVSITFEEPEPNIVAYVNSTLEEWDKRRKEKHLNLSMENVTNMDDALKLLGDLQVMGDTRLNRPCQPNYIANTPDILNYRKCYDGFAYKDSELREIENFTFKFAFFGYSGYRSISSAKIEGIKEIKDSPLTDSLNFSKPIKSDLLFQWIANMKANVAFASQEGKKELAEQYNQTIKHIEKAIEDIIGYNVEFIYDYKAINVKIKINNEELEFDVLPDGIKSIISWITDLIMRLERLKWSGEENILDRNFILLIDEIDIHLHPSWQRKILPVIQKLFRNAQIFVATHSPFVVGSIDKAWIYKMDIKDGKGILKETVEAKSGNSYSFIIDDIFQIKEIFGKETEEEFCDFYRYRQELMKGNKEKYNEFIEISRRLINKKSIEVNDIIGRELKQMERITGEKYYDKIYKD